VSELGAHTVTVIRPPAKDPYGDPLPGTGTETTVMGCYVQPRDSTEFTDARDTTVTDLLAFIPPGTDILATDQVRWNGALYQVNEDPARWDDIDGVPHHLEVTLRRVEG
jgi:hypothetical protein